MSTKFYELGMLLEDRRVFQLFEEHLATGIVVNGTTGGGKSRFLHKLIEEHVRWKRGFLLIDPGDLVDDLLASFSRRIGEDRKQEPLLRKIHLLELNPAQMVRYDLFAPPDLKSVHPELREVYLRAWQHTKVHSASEAFLRVKGQTDFGVQVRLQRLLSNVFTGISTLVKGRHLPVGMALVLLDRDHPDHLKVYRQLKPKLPRAVVSDFETLHDFRRVQDVRTETESTLNLLRAELGPLMKDFLSGTGSEPVFSMNEAVASGGFVMVRVKKTPYASHQQNVALAALLVHDWFMALLDCPREKRRGSTLIIDELHQFLPALPDLPTYQRILRKYGGGLVLGTQDLISMRTGEVDHAPAILGLANTLVSFRMSWPGDIEIMSRLLFSRNIRFDKLVQTVFQHQGEYHWLRVRETSRQWSLSQQSGESQSEGEDVSHQTQESHSTAKQSQWSKSKGHALGTGTSEMDGWTRAQGHTSGQSESPIIVDGQRKQTLKLNNSGNSSSEGTSGSNSNSTTETNTETDVVGGGTTETNGTSIGTGRSHKSMRGTNQMQGFSVGGSESEKLLPLPKLERIEQDTGQLIDSVADQYEKFGSELTALPRQEGYVRIRGGEALRFRTADVPDAFRSPEAQKKAITWLERRLYQSHDYFFTPSAEDESPTREEEFDEFSEDAPRHEAGANHLRSEDDGEDEESPLL